MSKELIAIVSDISNYSIIDIIEKIINNFYNSIEEKCNLLREFSFKLKDEDTHNITSVYNNLCNTLIIEVQYFIKQRREVTIPYIQKEFSTDAKKSCFNCNGACSSRKSKRITEIEDSHYKINDLFSRLQKVALPLYSLEPYPQIYKDVRKYMLEIETQVIHLLYLEEALLLPKLIENAHAIVNI